MNRFEYSRLVREVMDGLLERTHAELKALSIDGRYVYHDDVQALWERTSQGLDGAFKAIEDEIAGFVPTLAGLDQETRTERLRQFVADVALSKLRAIGSH